MCEKGNQHEWDGIGLHVLMIGKKLGKHMFLSTEIWSITSFVLVLQGIPLKGDIRTPSETRFANVVDSGI